MKDYYRVLELSAGATDEQIRTQYKRLVRIYHPDRFTNSQDKSYVEEKLREINEAYQALLVRPGNRTGQQDEEAAGAYERHREVPPQPVATPAALAFGMLRKGERKALLFQLQNHGGVVQQFHLDYSDNSGWFQVTKGRRLQNQQPFPMEFAVVVDTSRLNPGEDYSGWLQIDMDAVVTRIPVSVQVAAPKLFSLLTARLMIALSMLTIVAVVVATRFFDFVLPIFSLSPAPVATVQLLVQQPPDLLVPAPTAATVSNRVMEASPTVLFDAVDTNYSGGSGRRPPQGELALGNQHITPSPTVAPSAVSQVNSRSQTEFVTPPPIVGRSRRSAGTPDGGLLPPEERLQQTSVAIPNKESVTPTPTRKTPVAVVPTATLPPQANNAETRTTPFVPPAAVNATAMQTATSTATEPVVPTTTTAPTVAVTPTATPTATPSATATATETATATGTATATKTVTAAPTVTFTPAPTVTTTATSVATVTSTVTAVATPTSRPTSTATVTRTPTFVPSATPTATASPVATATPTLAPATATVTAAPTIPTSDAATATVDGSSFVPFPTAQLLTARVTIVIPDTYNVNARSDTSVNADVVQVLVSGTQWAAVGRTIDNTWLYMQLDSERFAWVYRETVNVALEQVDMLPIIVPGASQ